MLDLRRCLLAAGLSVTLAAMGCGSDSNPVEEDDGGPGEPTPDMHVTGAEPAGPSANIGVHCNVADGEGENELNPACEDDARCLNLNDVDGICVVFACRQDNTATGSTNEDSCRLDYGPGFVCIDTTSDVDTNDSDNVCVKTCTPSTTSNPCEVEFACTTNSRRFNFKDLICFDLACQTDADCRVSVTNDVTCMADGDCTAGEVCQLINDTDDDNVADIGACTVDGSCNNTNGLCAPHSLGNPNAKVGDPCQADTDCTDGGICVNEGPYTDVNSVTYRVPRNGYCTIAGCLDGGASGHACPAGSACYTAYSSGLCMDLCDQTDPTGCRDDLDADMDPTGNGIPCDPANAVTTGCDWYGDYECLDWGGFTWNSDGTDVVQGGNGTICEYLMPVQRGCDNLASIMGGCSALSGVTDNPEGLDCRYPRTGLATASGSDEDGRCLDDVAVGTGSGPLCPGSWGAGVCTP